MNLKGKRILVVGASSGIAVELNRALYQSGAIIGLHYNKNATSLSEYKEDNRLKKFQKDLASSSACFKLVDDFVNWANGIDYLVQLSGDINRPIHWEELTKDDWDYDLNINLLMPFFLAQRTVSCLKEKGGRIILMSTASASHGGGTMSLAYGVAKAGIECVVKKLAKDCAKYNILVNAIALGCIQTGFHTKKMNKTKEQMSQRIKLIPLKRQGSTEEVSAAIIFLLSEGASYITGQTIAVSGGDWL